MEQETRGKVLLLLVRIVWIRSIVKYIMFFASLTLVTAPH